MQIFPIVKKGIFEIKLVFYLPFWHMLLNSFKVLQAASEEYRCVDTFRGSLHNILYIFCHNPKSLKNQFREFWDMALHTDVKFRSDFWSYCWIYIFV